MNRITDPVNIGTLTLRNRLYRAPVLEGAGKSRDPGAVYAKHFVPNVQAGLGLVIQGNTIVTTEGRTSPGMNCVTDAESLLRMRKMTDAVHDAGGHVITQLGHGGLFALESWNREFIARATSLPLAPSKLPLWARPIHRGVRVPDTTELGAMAKRFGLVARWARDAGYDGVQLAGANAKFLHQMLSRTYNRRTDRYGRDIAGRTTFLREIRDAIGKEAGDNFPVLLKYTALEIGAVGGGISLEEGVEIARIAEDAGFAALTPAITSALPDTSLCRGGFPGKSFENKRLDENLRNAHRNRLTYWLARAGFRMSAWQYPYEPAWNAPVFKAVKAAVDIPIFAVGGIRTPEQAARILGSGHADLIGIGRPFYAEPDLARRFLGDGEAEALRCENCNRCVVPQMLGMPGVCYNPASQKPKKRRERAAA